MTTVPYMTGDSFEFGDMTSGAPIVPVLVNGYRARFLFDTGTRDILVTDEFAERMETMKRFSGFEEGVDEQAAHSPGPDPLVVQVGSLKFTGSILSLKSVSLSGLVHSHIDGILGKKALENAAVLLSPASRTLTFYLPGNLTQHDRDEIGMGEATAVPLKLTSDQLLSTVAVFTQKSTSVSEELLLDTGAKDTVISEDAFRELNGPVVAQDTLMSVWGSEEETLFTVDQAALGSLIVPGPILGFSANQKIQLPVVLGRDILLKYRLLIDAPAKTMYLLPSTAPASLQ